MPSSAYSTGFAGGPRRESGLDSDRVSAPSGPLPILGLNSRGWAEVDSRQPAVLRPANRAYTRGPLSDQNQCVTCGSALIGRHCASCGELSPRHLNYSLQHFLHEASDSVFHVDGRVLKSFRMLLRQPGQLTLDYLRGRRKPYVRPVELFLLANLLYFLIQPFTGFAAFTTPLIPIWPEPARSSGKGSPNGWLRDVWPSGRSRFPLTNTISMRWPTCRENRS